MLENIFDKKRMYFDFNAKGKTEALDILSEKIAITQGLDQSVILEKLLCREEVSSTGIGNGIAIPHASVPGVDTPFVVYAKSDIGVPFDSLDGNLVHHFFCIIVPEGRESIHLDILAELSKQLMHEETIQKLDKAQSFEDVVGAFSSESVGDKKEYSYQFLAVTACATGIAHTYMAQEKLEIAAKDLGKSIKVETNGSSGVKNSLSPQEIENAEAIIVASDIKVEMDRFDGKKVLKVPVSQAIKDPQKLLNEAQKAPIYHANNDSSVMKSAGQKNLYGNLMSGISYMLSFVVGGGILIAISFLIDQILGVPENELSQLGTYHPIAASLNQIGGMAFSFMLPVLSGYIAYGIADRPGLVVGFVAGGLANAGGAGFLGALIGGFIAGFLMNFVKKLLSNLPPSLEGIKTILLYPLLGLIMTGVLMLLLNVPMKLLNDSLNKFLENLSGTNAAVLGLLLGAMMALDLGGPVNKAAYVFGTGTLAASNGLGSSVMAAVMAAGMVPPLAVFIATKMSPNIFTEQERQAGNTNLILGASFITEGAIPFASKNPLRVIPSYVVGSSLASAFVMLSEITVSAPHGGIFVIFLVSKPILYLLYVLLGSMISAILMVIFLKEN